MKDQMVIWYCFSNQSVYCFYVMVLWRTWAVIDIGNLEVKNKYVFKRGALTIGWLYSEPLTIHFNNLESILEWLHWQTCL